MRYFLRVSLSVAFLIALAAPLTAILLSGRRLAAASRRAVIPTGLATWVLTTVALCWLVPDPSDIGALLTVFFLVVPWIGIPLAAILATLLVGVRGRRGWAFVQALVLALLGWIAGVVVVVVFLDASHAAALPCDFWDWDYAYALALPACYSACGAVVAAGLGARST